jgi:hypothetical protein
MSVIVPLEVISNQAVSFQVGDVRYDMRFRNTGSIMSLDLSINDEVILSGSRVVGGFPLIPYKYLEGAGGNFIFSTELGDLVWWEQFGITQSLFYFTPEELEEIRAN